MAFGQLGSVYGLGSGRMYRTPYVQQVRGAYGQATADVLARKKREQEQKEMKFDQKMQENNLDLLKQQQKDAAEQGQRATGIQLGTLGLNIAQRSQDMGLGGASMGQGLISKGLNALNLPSLGGSGINFGSMAGSGLAGYGAYKALGGGAKGVAGGIGAGLLTDAITGGGATGGLTKKAVDWATGFLF